MLKLTLVLATLEITGFSNTVNGRRSTEPFSIDRVEDSAQKFEILTLAQSWPQTNCWEINNEWEAAESKCSPCRIRDKTNQWTLHGAWPSNRRRNHPSFCGGMKYQPELLDAPLRSELEYKWPTMKSKSSDDAFWTHEWKKHGTCAGEVETMNSVSNYFSESLRLLNQYNVGSFLEQSQIVPGKTYELNRIRNAIKIGFGVNPFISCSTNKISGKEYLSQVSICFEKSLHLADCQDDGKKFSNCKSNQIIYPEIFETC